jgi:sulfoxide reductase catalytic subunit YedY
MLIKAPADIRSSEITDQKLYLNRREFVRLATAGAAAGAAILGGASAVLGAAPAPHGRKFEGIGKSPLSTTEKQNSWNDITSYNNYYEFGTDKDSPAKTADRLKVDPWSVVVDGECNKKATYHLEDIVKGEALEERVYRHRCVEGWSMVIPWVGFPIANFIKRCEPTAKAKFVQFTTLSDASQMPGVRVPVLNWPYTEGLRMDEAMHPLAIFSVGLYGEVLPKQNGAPLRLVLPWKYGFKSIKSIVKIRFVEKQPLTSWQDAAPEYYQFYSNVNPGQTNSTFRDQSTERRLGEFLMRRTQIFNGYGDQVAGLYAGMDLKKNY